MLEVYFKRCSEDAILPDKAYTDAAAYDLYSVEDKLLPPGDYALLRTGWQIQLPPQTEAQIRPKSGLALKHGVTLLNTPGTIDADYRGELGVIMINHGKMPFQVVKGSKIAQMIVSKLCPTELTIVEQLNDSARGAGGFGSSGQFRQESECVLSSTANIIK